MDPLQLTTSLQKAEEQLTQARTSAEKVHSCSFVPADHSFCFQEKADAETALAQEKEKEDSMKQLTEENAKKLEEKEACVCCVPLFVSCVLHCVFRSLLLRSRRRKKRRMQVRPLCFEVSLTQLFLVSRKLEASKHYL